MFLAAVPFTIATYVVGVLYPARDLAIYFLQVIATLPIFLVTIGLVFRTYVRGQIIPRVKSLLFAGAR
jgi:hypothetical protein